MNNGVHIVDCNDNILLFLSKFFNFILFKGYMKNSFVIATLTCNDRMVLFDMINDVCSYTTISDVTWFIYAQGCSAEFINKITDVFRDKPYITLKLATNPINEGYSRGMNAVWNNVKDETFVLFLEDDWRVASDVNKDWLNTSLELINDNTPKVDIIYLRRYLTDEEKFQYGWTRHIDYIYFEGRKRFNYAEQMENTKQTVYGSNTFQQIPNFMYTANPCIYRTETYKKCGVFPMIEFQDVHNERAKWSDSSHLSKLWGHAEALSMEKTANCFVLYLCDGIFYHDR
jgi:hypothetical protein